MEKTGIKLPFDIGVSKRAEVFFKEQGYDVLSARDINPRISDKEILSIAITDNRLVITTDKDFGELVFNTGISNTSVLLLRMEDAGWQQKIEVLLEILSHYSDKLMGSFSVYQDKKLRIRNNKPF